MGDILDKHDKYDYEYVCGKKKFGPWKTGNKYCTNTAHAYGYHNDHSLDMPSVFQKAMVKSILLNQITIYLSSLIADKIIRLHKNAAITLISESSKKWVVKSGDYTHDFSTIFNIQNFIQNGNVYTKILHTYNSVFHGGDISGEVGDLTAIGITTGGNAPQLNGHPTGVVALSSSYNQLVSKLDDIGAVATMGGVGSAALKAHNA